MNKKYGIGFLICTILIIVLFSFMSRISYQRAEEKQEEGARTQGEVEVCYYIKEHEGYVTVFEGDLTTVYEYTTIRVVDLPEEVQEDLKKGIKLTSLGQVYGFLENYSS